MSFEAFSTTYVLRRSAEHALLIISEAVKALAPDLTERYPKVDWPAIRSIGNVLRHAYFEVDAQVLWRIVQKDLPKLERVIAKMIDEQGR